MRNDGDEILPLVCALCEGTITDGQFRRMDALLRADAAARKVYRCYLDLDEALLEALGAPGITPGTTPGIAPGATRSPRHRRAVSGTFIRYTAAAAIVLAFVGLLGVILSYSTRPAADRPAVATLVDAADAVWSDDAAITPGTQLPSGTLHLKSGTVQLEFYSSARVTLTGPAEFGLNSPMRGFLRSGKLTAYVPPKAHGFTIASPGCAVIDLGTAFKMSITPDHTTEVHVTAGHVEVRDLTQPDAVPIRLAQGQTLRSAGFHQPLLPVAQGSNHPGPLLSEPGDVLRVKAGEFAPVTDAHGVVYQGDQPYAPGGWGYIGGQTYLVPSVSDQLLRRCRFGSFSYRFDVPPGEYEVAVVVAETAFDKPGMRRFSVAVNGAPLVKNLDLIAEAGPAKPVRRSVIVNAAAGIIELTFHASTNQPLVNAIELRRIR